VTGAGSVRRTAAWRVGALLLALIASGCAKSERLNLPSGPGETAADAASIAAAAFARCGDLRTLTAEIGLSGRAARQKLRARLIAGFADPASIRLEAVAPFGPPGFILAAGPDAATLLLPRDDRVLTGAEPAAILEALAGISLSPDDLRLLVGGCPSASPKVASGTRYGSAWMVLDLGPAGTAYLQPRGTGWQLAAIVRPELTVEYPQRTEAPLPSTVRLRDPGDAPRFDLTMRLSQVEVNVPVPAEAFTVKVPPDAVPVTLEELRDSGPMRDTATGNAERGTRN